MVWAFGGGDGGHRALSYAVRPQDGAGNQRPAVAYSTRNSARLWFRRRRWSSDQTRWRAATVVWLSRRPARVSRKAWHPKYHSLGIANVASITTASSSSSPPAALLLWWQ